MLDTIAWWSAMLFLVAIDLMMVVFIASLCFVVQRRLANVWKNRSKSSS
jgi:hypothetical protein